MLRGLLALCIWTSVSIPALAAEPIDFNRDVRPILSDKCFRCHGFDQGSRQADLRLDVRADVVRMNDGNAAIVPGKLDKSLVWQRITSKDEDLRMPPADSHKTLKPEEIETIRKWIESGAKYDEHWSFTPIVKPEVPTVRNGEWTKNAIDHFILDRLERNGLTPSPEADKATLLRRVWLDLVGFPPPPEVAAEFLESSDPADFERMVDRLLASPHFGERWGRHWLDQARYADSNGYTIDGARVMWPFRDYVISAVNADMPFDQFTLEQVAGDLLEKPTTSQLVATAFHRNTMINEEGGVKPDQFRVEALIDRVNTTGAVWLGLTLGCAQCHTHKFDPISQADYFRLYAYFNSCQDTNNVGPTVAVHRDEMLGWPSEYYTKYAELTRLRKELDGLSGGSKLAARGTWKPAIAESSITKGLDVQSDGSVLVNPESKETTYQVRVVVKDKKVSGLRVKVLTHPSLPEKGPGLASNGNFILTDVAIEANNQTMRFAEAEADHEQQGYPASATIDNDPKTGWAINVSAAQKKLKRKMNADHALTLRLPEPVDVEFGIISVTLRHDEKPNYRVGRFAVETTSVFADDPSVNPTRKKDVQQRIAALERSLPGGGKPVQQMVMKNAAKPEPTYLMKRGDFLNPDRERGPLVAGTPEVLPKLKNADATPDRLDLAKWLVAKENPLVPRVTVNRIWMRLFGRGIVETENDFGYQGAPPSHPELLNWLSAEFRDDCKWSLKSFIRKIVTSATYRQVSDFQETLASADPNNELLGRQTRIRIDAEVVRDSALAASGALSTKIGGPSVFPPQPEGVYSFTQNVKRWATATGSDRYRRSMYTMFFRSAPYPLLTTFDAPDFCAACTKRSPSNTPLQALTVANDESLVELAGHLAERIETETKPDAPFRDRLAFAFRCSLARLPSSSETETLARYWEQLKAQEGETAAWKAIARVLFNTDEFVTRN